MTDVSNLGLSVAFAAGVVSFLSPCVLPVVPGYLSYIAGQASGTATPRAKRRRLTPLVLSACFVLGFGSVFVILGASATALGQLFVRYRYEANLIGGAIVIAFGFLMLGAQRLVPWLRRDLRIHPRVAGGHPGAAFVLGIAFGFGWTPCIGPILGAILTISAVQSTLQGGIGLLIAYALGLGVPFLLAAVFTRELIGRMKVLRRAGRPLQVAAGLIMVLFGVAMVSGKLTTYSYWLLERFPALARIG